METHLEVNVDGTFLTTWAVKDEMIARRFGRIVNVSSLAGLIKKKDMIHYATAKSAVISFTRHCADAFVEHNIRVNGVAPGLHQLSHPAIRWPRATTRPIIFRTIPSSTTFVIFITCSVCRRARTRTAAGSSGSPRRVWRKA